MASNLDEALAVAQRDRLPADGAAVVRAGRPGHGGRSTTRRCSREYVAAAVDVSPERPILIDRFLENAIEVEADCLADGEDAFVPAVMEHIELAGIHSGDSACVIPPISIPPKHIDTIYQYNRKIAIELNVVGLMNIQYAIQKDTVYILEANPRASRTVPLVSKVCNIPMARIATQIMLGKKLSELGLGRKTFPHFGVKEAVFPFNMYHEVDPLLGPEMRSTGEVLGMAESFGLAFYKAQEAAGQHLPLEGTVLITVADRDKPAVVEVARRFAELGFRIKATAGHAGASWPTHGIPSELILKMHEGRPNIADAIMDGEIQLVINTPRGKVGKADDAYIRKTAIKRKVPYITTLAAAVAAAKGIAADRQGHGQVKSLQELSRGHQVDRASSSSVSSRSRPWADSSAWPRKPIAWPTCSTAPTTTSHLGTMRGGMAINGAERLHPLHPRHHQRPVPQQVRGRPGRRCTARWASASSATTRTSR